jgi:hypothetical protein
MKIDAHLLGQTLMACRVSRVYVVGYALDSSFLISSNYGILLTLVSFGHKMNLEDFLADFENIVIMDPYDPPQLDLARYHGERQQIILLRPEHNVHKYKLSRGIVFTVHYLDSISSSCLFLFLVLFPRTMKYIHNKFT